MKKSKRALYARAAAKCRSGVRDALTSKWTASKQAKHEARRLGSFGAASEVVQIDPSEYKPAILPALSE